MLKKFIGSIVLLLKEKVKKLEKYYNRKEIIMKKISVTLLLMVTFIFTAGSVFAASYYPVEDSCRYEKSTFNWGEGVLSGQRENVTGKLSSVRSSKTEAGSVTVSLGSISRPSQFSAKMTVNIYNNGAKVLNANLSL